MLILVFKDGTMKYKNHKKRREQESYMYVPCEESQKGKVSYWFFKDFIASCNENNSKVVEP